MRIILSIIFYCVLIHNCIGQIKTDTVNICYFDNIAKEFYRVQDICITNICDEDLLLWFNNTSNEEYSVDDEVLLFFLKKHGDFNYLNLMYEDLIYSDSLVIGSTFIKRIAPSDKFHVIIMNVDSVLCDRRNISISTKSNVEKCIRSVLSDKLYYKDEYVILKNSKVVIKTE